MMLQTVSAAAWGPAPSGGTLPSLSQDCTAQLSIEAPSSGGSVAGNMTVSGWAVDLTAPSGSGIDAVRLYWDAPSEEGGVGLGVATIGLARPDVDASLGLSDSNAGWELPIDFSALPAGSHTLYAYARSLCGWTYIATDVYVEPTAAAAPAANAPAVIPPSVSVPAAAPAAFSQPVVRIESPTAGSNLTSSQPVTGFAIDCASGRPATSVKVYAGSGSGTLLGNATVGASSRDMATMCGAGRTGTANAGFTFQLNPSALPGGAQTVSVVADTGSATATSSVLLNVPGNATAGAGGQAGTSGSTGGYNAQTGYNSQTGQTNNPYGVNPQNPNMAGAANLGTGCAVGSTYSPTASGCANNAGTVGSNMNPNPYPNANAAQYPYQNNPNINPNLYPNMNPNYNPNYNPNINSYVNPALTNPNLYGGTTQYNGSSSCPVGSVASGSQCLPNTSYYAAGGLGSPYGTAGYQYGGGTYPYTGGYPNTGLYGNQYPYTNTGYNPYGATGNPYGYTGYAGYGGYPRYY